MSNNTLSDWLEDYLCPHPDTAENPPVGEAQDGAEAVPAPAREENAHEKELRALFSSHVAQSLGGLTPEEITEERLTSWENELRESGAEEETAFDAVSLVSSLLTYIEEKTAVPMPHPEWRTAKPRGPELSVAEATLLRDTLLNMTSREAACCYLLLRTNLSARELLCLPRKQLKQKENTVTLAIHAHVVAGKTTPIEPREICATVTDAETAFLRRAFPRASSPDELLATGTEKPVDRRRLRAALSDACVAAGIPDITPAVLEKTEWATLFDETEEDRRSRDLFGEEPAAAAGKIEPEPLPEEPETPSKSARRKKAGAEEDGSKKMPRIPRKEMYELTRTFPTPVLEHCRRCRAFTRFLAENLMGETWFVDMDIDTGDLAMAVYYHDIGKKDLKLDDYFLEGRPNEEQKIRYRAHVGAGLAMIQGKTDLALDEYPGNCFEGLLRDAIADHHERPDGRGFPTGKKGASIGFAGGVAALADELDHRLFSATEPGASVTGVLADLQKQAGKRFDERLVTLLLNRAEAFVPFVEHMRAYYGKKRRHDEYGMRYRFRPYLDGQGNVAAREAILFCNDPYYGMVDAAILLPVVEEHPRFGTFIRLALERICRLVEEADGQGKDPGKIIIRLPVGELTKRNFFTDLFRMFVDHGISYRRFAFAVSEEEAIGRGVDLCGMAEKFHVIGADFALCDVGGGASLLPSIGRILPDIVILRPEYGVDSRDPGKNDLLTAIANAAVRYRFRLFCPGTGSDVSHVELLMKGVSAIGAPDACVEEKDWIN